MTTSNAATDTAVTASAEKSSEKLAEKRRALGRGLESLLPGPRVVAAAPPDVSFSSSPSSSDVVEAMQAAAGHAFDGEHAFELALDQIEENPHQTRQEFDPKALSELAGSIRMQGVLQPIVVRPSAVRPSAVGPGVSEPGGPQRFTLILGERRFRASKIAGKTTIPAIVKRVSEQQAAEMTLVENLQRQDLHCLEQAAAFANLSKGFHLTQEEIGKRVGVSREQVSNYLRLLRLPAEVLTALRQKDLSYSHARLLLALDDDSQITKMAHVVMAKKMSVALLEELVMASLAPKGEAGERKASGARWQDPNVRAAQRSLEAVLGMRVRIRDRSGKGKITIEYGTLEDFDRVVGMFKGKASGEPA